jgi:hypothetical protein
VNPLPPGSPLGTFATGGTPQQFAHHMITDIYKNTPLALLGPKWDQLLAEARPLTHIGWSARYSHHRRGRGRRMGHRICARETDGCREGPQ